MLRKIKFLTFLLVTLSLFNIEVAFCAKKVAISKACVDANGVILIRSKCKKSEKLLSALMLNREISGSQALAGPTGSQGPEGITGDTGNVGLGGATGPQGIPGSKGVPGELSFSACRLTVEQYTTNFSNPANPILYAEVFCDENTEFLLADESRVFFFPASTGTKVALQARSPYYKTINGDEREYGVGIYANRTSSVGDGTYQFIVRGVCCPR